VNDKYYFGCTVGRVTNRIKNGRFQLDGIVYELEKNDNGKHYLHGVFNKRVWDSSTENGDTVVFKYQSPDGIYIFYLVLYVNCLISR
jgi:aldose 1-epimerase